MSVDVHRDTDVAVPHEILQRLGVHTRLRLIATVGVPAYMRCDLRHLHPVDFVIFLSDVLKILFPVPDDFSAEDTALRRIRQQS